MDRLLLEFGGIFSGHSANPSLAEVGTKPRTLQNLLAKATTHAQRFQDGEDHTVAAALLTKSGKHVLGLNAHHFLGGPCGEISALANHAASYPEDPIQAVVAVYGPTGQIIPPCGKCRQVQEVLKPQGLETTMSTMVSAPF